MVSDQKLIVVVGATASGKTAVSINIAHRLSGEIIAADSKTVYRGLDIGTAKPSKEERLLITHHCIDLVQPDQQYTAASFKSDANSAMNIVRAANKLPIMTGGSGLYIDSVLFDYEFKPPADPEIRAFLDEKSVIDLQNLCRKKGIALPVNHQNKVHLIRALETGGVSTHRRDTLLPGTKVFGILLDNDTLKFRSKERALQMIKNGVIDEATDVASRYGWQSPGLKGGIYPLIHEYVERNESVDWLVDAAVRSDMQLAKRQKTWFKRNSQIEWFDTPIKLMNAAEQFYASV